MNLSEMDAAELLDEYANKYAAITQDKWTTLPPYKILETSNECDALRAELLRRLQPVKPRCPKCGSERKLNWHREYSRVECQACDNFSAEVCTVEDWAVLFGPVLSREGEGEA